MINPSPEKMTPMPGTENNVDALPGKDEKQSRNAEQEEAKRRSTLSDEQASKLTSFLEIDRSFFSPWNWDPNFVETSALIAEPKPRMVFQEGSLISFNIHNFTHYATECRKIYFEQEIEVIWSKHSQDSPGFCSIFPRP